VRRKILIKSSKKYMFCEHIDKQYREKEEWAMNTYNGCLSDLGVSGVLKKVMREG
jgi:hypothetical protein